MFADFFFHSLDIFVTQNKSDLHSLSGREKLNEILCDHYECIVVGRHVHIAIFVVVIVASTSQLIVHFVCSLNRLFVCSDRYFVWPFCTVRCHNTFNDANA